MKCEIPFTAIASVLVIFAIVPSLATSVNGQNAPDFHLVDLGNTSHSLSDYNGSVIVLDFFSVESADCQTGAKNVLVPLYNNYSSGANVQFISIETTGASADTINTTYVNSTGITWPILTGGENVANLYGTNNASNVYVIDPAGNIVFSMTYPLNEEALKASIDKLLEASTSLASSVKLDTKSPITPTLENSITNATPTPSALPTSTSKPLDTSQIAQTSNVSKANQSSKTIVTSSLVSGTSVSPAKLRLSAQNDHSAVSTEFNNYVTPLASLSGPSQKTLLCSPSLFTPIVSSSVIAQATAMSTEACALSQGFAISCVVPAIACQDNTIPTVTLPAQTNAIASLPVQSIGEYSLLGLGAPMLLIGVLYLLLRRV